jgi:hypothetical protein
MITRVSKFFSVAMLLQLLSSSCSHTAQCGKQASLGSLLEGLATLGTNLGLLGRFVLEGHQVLQGLAHSLALLHTLGRALGHKELVDLLELVLLGEEDVRHGWCWVKYALRGLHCSSCFPELSPFGFEPSAVQEDQTQ